MTKNLLEKEMKVIVSVSSKKEENNNRDKLEAIKKIVNGNIEIVYSKEKEIKPKKLSSLSGLISVGGDSVMDSDTIYE